MDGLGGWGQGGEEGIGGLYLKKTKLESQTKFCAASNVLEDRGTGMGEGRAEERVGRVWNLFPNP